SETSIDRTTKKKTVYFEGAQLMTSIEMLDALARSTWGTKMKDVFKELQPKFKKIKAAIKAHEKGLDKAAKDAEKKAAQEQKACEQAEKQRQVAEEKERKRVEKEKIKEGKRLEKEGAAAQISVGRQRGRGGARGGARDDDSGIPVIAPVHQRPRPRPRPKPVQKRNDTNATEDPASIVESEDEIPASRRESASDINLAEEVLEGEESPVEEVDEGGSDSETDSNSSEECIINCILQHQRSWGKLMFEVSWVDGDVTWQDLQSIDKCIALDEYLKKHGVKKPKDLV
ncbi:hypothetical protein D9758_018744, partial [Tetrapyrgos nigripes]